MLNDILDNKAKSFVVSDSAHGKQQCQYLSAERVAEMKACRIVVEMFGSRNES